MLNARLVLPEPIAARGYRYDKSEVDELIFL